MSATPFVTMLLPQALDIAFTHEPKLYPKFILAGVLDGQIEFVRLLIVRSSVLPPIEALIIAILIGNVDMAKMLVEEGKLSLGDINITTDDIKLCHQDQPNSTLADQMYCKYIRDLDAKQAPFHAIDLIRNHSSDELVKWVQSFFPSKSTASSPLEALLDKSDYELGLYLISGENKHVIGFNVHLINKITHYRNILAKSGVNLNLDDDIKAIGRSIREAIQRQLAIKI